MFWAYNANSPQIDIILCKEDLTLQELLDQENVLQELKAQNLKLIEFLLKPEILHELVMLITTEPSSDLDEAEQYKYPNLACELLTSDLPAINERLASEEILNKLYCFLQNDPPLNPLLSSYFSRTLSILISRKSEQNWYSYQYTCLQALEFLKAKEEFMELLFRHMGTSSIMDLMHNLVTLIEGPELKQSLRGWLQNQNVIPNLVSLLSPNIDANCQVNAASALCSIIQKLRENAADLNEKPESDPILNLLESIQTIELVLSTAFSSETVCETSIESAIEVLMILMQPHLPGESQCRQMLHYSVHDKLESGLTAQNVFTDDTPPVRGCHTLSLSDIILAVIPYIKKMKQILQNPIKTESITLTSGVVSPPFGRARLVVVKFIAVLISVNNAAINKEIILCDIPELLLDLFYAYSSNNFLHTEVEKLIAYAIDNLNGYTVTDSNDDIIFIHLLKKCNLLRRLLDMWKENVEREKEGKFRRGYMGHVIRIFSFIHIEEAKMSTFHDLLVKEVTESCLNDWNTFVNENLKFIIELHSSCLGGVRPRLCQSSDNSFEESSYKEPKSSFREYDPDEDQNAIFTSESSAIPYGSNNDVTEDEQERQSEIFNAICSQKWPSFVEGLDDIDEENEREENDRMNVWKTEREMDDAVRAWGSDDEYCDEDRENTSDPWSKLGNVSDPWAESSISSSDDSNWKVDSNWANFDENFEGSGSKDGDQNQSPSSASMTTGTEPYSLFGSAMQEKTTLLKKFSTLKIGEDCPDGHFGGVSPNLVNGSDWNVVEGENAAGTADVDGPSFDLSAQFNCFGGGHEKDSSDEMLNLESICGNTLAEKIANAENDIRSKDEILMRGMHEQRQQQCATMQSNFLTVDSCSADDSRSSSSNSNPDSNSNVSSSNNGNFSCSSNSNDSNNSIDGVKDIDNGIGSCKEVVIASSYPEEYFNESVDCMSGTDTKGSSNGERLSTEEYFGSPPADCLTENSVDFVTADNNSSSDAESSVEFGDADNSLEFDGEVADDSHPIVGASCDRRGNSLPEQVVVATASDTSASTVDTLSSGSSSNGNTAANDWHKCGEVPCENVPKTGDNVFGDTCNNGATELENDGATEVTALSLKSHSLANGDVAASDNLTDCVMSKFEFGGGDTEAENASDAACSSNSEQLKKNTDGAIVTGPA